MGKLKKAKTYAKGLGRVFLWTSVGLFNPKSTIYYCGDCGITCGVDLGKYTSLDEECGWCEEKIDYKNKR